MNGLETEFGAALIVLRVDISDPAGQQVSLRYGSRTTPTFILLDGSGSEIWRQVGGLDADQVRAALARP